LADYQKQYRTESLAAEAGATQAGKTRAEVRTKALETNNAEIRNAIGTPYDEATTMLENTRDLRKQIESGQFQKTGVFEGPMAKMMGDPEAARLQAQAIGQALKNLQITNLAPVTEAEIALIQELYAGIGSDPEQNVQILLEAEKMLQQKLDQIDKVATYYANNNDSLEGYGMSRYRKAPGGDTPKISGPARPGS
jgi:chromosome condensin MukBEF ATPase and DNA-binding subunit MukB